MSIHLLALAVAAAGGALLAAGGALLRSPAGPPPRSEPEGANDEVEEGQLRQLAAEIVSLRAQLADARARVEAPADDAAPPSSGVGAFDDLREQLAAQTFEKLEWARKSADYEERIRALEGRVPTPPKPHELQVELQKLQKIVASQRSEQEQLRVALARSTEELHLAREAIEAAKRAAAQAPPAAVGPQAPRVIAPPVDPSQLPPMRARQDTLGGLFDGAPRKPEKKADPGPNDRPTKRPEG